MSHDDPRLTAYALKELDAKERVEFEEILARDDEARKCVGEILETADLLRQEYRKESSPGLTKDQRERIETRAHGKQEADRESGRSPRYWILGLIPLGAVGVTVLTYGLLFQSARTCSVTGTRSNSVRLQNDAYGGSREVRQHIYTKQEPMADEATGNSIQAGVHGAGQGLVSDGNSSRPQQMAMLPPGASGKKQDLGLGAPMASPAGASPIENKKMNRVRWVELNEGVEKRPLPTHVGDESYNPIVENEFLDPKTNPLSTFSINVGTASYSNVRRYLEQGMRPPADAVRIEELINYFHYDYPKPEGDEVFTVHAEVASAPWKPSHRLLKIGIKGREMDRSKRPVSNLVFLVDVSGSMQDENKLPLFKSGMRLLVEQLGENDVVSMVVYAGAAGVVLQPTNGQNKKAILDALDQMQAGGSTNGGEGIQIAYDLAVQRFIKGGVNRVILATDGDFNVGVSSQGDLTRLIEEKAKTGVFLTILGFGMGNLKDSNMDAMANKGRGTYAYIDSLQEAKKVMVEQMSGTLVTIAKDVKLQLEFNPMEVSGYRLIGYENRMLKAEDFNDDKKDAGGLGAGHNVTALYEIVPRGQENLSSPGVDPLKYQTPPSPDPKAVSHELLTVKLRFKKPDKDQSELLSFPVTDSGKSLEAASPDFKFGAAVGSFGLILRGSKYRGEASLESVESLARAGLGNDTTGYRQDFLALVGRARQVLGQ